MRKIYAQMLEEKVPMSIKELAINGKDLQKLGIEGREIGQTLSEIWDMALRNSVPNEREKLLEIAEKKAKYVSNKRKRNK